MIRKNAAFIFAPLLSIGCLVLGLGFFLTFISLKLDQDGYSNTVIALVLSIYFTGQLIGAFIVEPIITFVGRIRAFAATASLLCTTTLVMALSESVEVWVAMRFVAGFCIAAQYVVVESWLLTISDSFSRGRVLALYMIVLYVGSALSQLIIEFIDLDSVQAFLYSAIFASLAVIPICFSPRESLHMPDVIPHSFRELVVRSPLGFIGSFVSGAVITCIYGFAPIFAVNHGVSVGWLMFSTVLGGVLLQWPLGKLSDYLDRRKVLIATSGLLAIPSFLLVYYPDNQLFIMAMSFLIGGISFTIYPLSIAEVSDRFSQEHVTRVAIALLIAYEVGCIAGPLAVPLVTRKLGDIGIYHYIAVLGLALFGIGIVRSILVKPVPLEEQTEFVTLPRVSPVGLELDPRVEIDEN